MSYFSSLIKSVLECELFRSIDDLLFVFPDYEISKGEVDLRKETEVALKWAYECNEMDDFYLEYSDAIKEWMDFAIVITCSMSFDTSVPTYGSFDLFRFESKDLFYYMVQSYGNFADLMDSSGFYAVIPKESTEDIILSFREQCNDIYRGDFSSDEINLYNGSIGFYKG